MAMRNCDNCLENIWSFKKIDGYIIATCDNCGNQVEWEHRKTKMSSGDKCRKNCGGTVYKRESKFKAKKLKRAFFYTHTYKCNKCNQTYLAEEFKIKRGTKKWHEFEQRTTKQDKTADWIRLQQGSGYDRNGVLDQDNWSSSSGQDYLPTV